MTDKKMIEVPSDSIEALADNISKLTEAAEKMMDSGLTQSRLKELLHYDTETGLFTWLRRHSGVKINNIAGTPHPKGYIKVTVDGKSYFAHRLAFLYMTGKWPKDQTDHINNIKTDNMWINLRECNGMQNQQNRPMTSKNSSGYKGVSWDKKHRKWHAQIKYNKKTFHLKSFDCKHEAARAYNKKAIELHGEFAYVNKITNA